MATVNFKWGKQASLPSDKALGTLYFVTDERAIYLDYNDGENDQRIRMGDFIEAANVAELDGIENPSSTALYYVKDLNVLAKYEPPADLEGEGRWIQINLDTGATSVDTSAEGNALTGATYDATGRKITFTKGNFAEVTHSHELGGVNGLTEALAEKAKQSDVDTLTQKVNGLSGAMHIKGKVEEDPLEMAEPEATYSAGDVVYYGNKEYVFLIDDEHTPGAFVELGDTTALAAQVSSIETKANANEAKLVDISTTVTDYVAEKTTGMLTEDALTDYAKTEALETLKTELIGTQEGITATDIKAGVKEAKDYADQKDTALKTELSKAFEWGEF